MTKTPRGNAFQTAPGEDGYDSLVRPASGIAGDAQPPEFSDDALALRFTARHQDDLRYVDARGKWFEWRGSRWEIDGTLHTYDLSRKICREASAAANTGAKSIASAKTVAAVERLVRADRCHAATIDQWDADPWFLNTPGRTVDLRTGDLRPARREDYCTRMTAVAPEGDCPLWLEFLNRIFAGDADLIAFMQRICGYALTGDVSEHALFFGHGTGANGKGRFVAALSGVMGDYATTAPMEMFTDSNNERHPTDLAGLVGARLVTAQETEKNRRWAETRIKTLTGGDKVSARFMRQDFFEYTPQFKLLIMGNHKPGLRGVDESIRRRMNLIPFTVTIPEDERDPHFDEKLRTEWPGILAWMIIGCLKWQEDGLRRPEAVRKATEAYLAAEDTLATWMSECCTTNPNDTAGAGALFASWSAWAERAGEYIGSQKVFSQGLQDRGFAKSHGRAGTMFRGIGIIPAEPPASYADRHNL
jgi:putative DNA primase/helicase